MDSTFSWVDLAALVVAIFALAVTVAIFAIGRRLSFRQQRDRVRELEAKAWKVLGPTRTEGLNSKIIVMNVERYKRSYDGSNDMTWRGHAFAGPEIIDISHGGVHVINSGIASYFDSNGHRTLEETPNPAPMVFECGHIPWEWIEDISPDGDEFDGSAIFFVRHRAPGRQPYDYVTYREGKSVPFGPNGYAYFRQVPELGTRRPQFFRDWFNFIKSLRLDKKMKAQLKQQAAEKTPPASVRASEPEAPNS